MSSTSKYDIFISYRREGGAQYARILQLMLVQRGYRVFLDYDELKDGLFNQKIKKAIASAPIFLLVLSKNAIDRCCNKNDWVSQEISEAVRLKKKIVPVNCDGQFDGIHTEVVDVIKSTVCDNSHSEVYFGQVLGVTVDQMIKERIKPIVGERASDHRCDEDFEAAKLTLQRQDAHRRWIKRLYICLSAIILAIVTIVATIVVKHINQEKEDNLQRIKLDNLRFDIENRHAVFKPILRANLTEIQLNTIDTLLQHMRRLNDNIWISQTEFSRGEWMQIMGEKCRIDEYDLPVTAKPYYKIIECIKDSLYEMTGIEFDLPSVEEWQYAANGGKYKQNFVYAGSNSADSVTWYIKNAANKLHPVINTGKIPNYLDLFNMNGNAAELCNTAAVDNQGNECWAICGGDYCSTASDVTNSSVRLLPLEACDNNVGFRILIRQ